MYLSLEAPSRDPAYQNDYYGRRLFRLTIPLENIIIVE
jgi:hypothetical protein